jgi:hypothetical protein
MSSEGFDTETAICEPPAWIYDWETAGKRCTPVMERSVAWSPTPRPRAPGPDGTTMWTVPGGDRVYLADVKNDCVRVLQKKG